MAKKLLALVLSVLMLVSLLPMSAFALGPTETVTTAEEFDTAIKDGSVSKITLGSDVTISAMYMLTRDLEIDLNGQKLSKNDGNSIVQVINNATLTITGTTANSAVYGRINVGISPKDALVKAGGAYEGMGNEANVVLNGGNYSCVTDNTCLHVNGECLTSNVTITGATITSPGDNGIQLNGKGIFAITDSKITGNTAIYMKAGQLTLTNTEVHATGAKQAMSTNHNGSNPNGSAIVLDTTTGYQGDITLIVAGEDNKITSNNSYAIQEGVTDASDSAVLSIAIEGGEFNSATGTDTISVSPQFATKKANGQATVSITGGTYSAPPAAELLPDPAGANATVTVKTSEGYKIFDESAVVATGTENGVDYVIVKDSSKYYFSDSNDRFGQLSLNTLTNNYNILADKQDTVITELVKAAIAAGSTVHNIQSSYLQFNVVSSNGTASGDSITYEAAPYIQAVKSGDVKFELKIENDWLAAGSYSVKLPNAGTEGQVVNVKHDSTKRGLEDLGNKTVESDKSVTVEVPDFSKFYVVKTYDVTLDYTTGSRDGKKTETLTTKFAEGTKIDLADYGVGGDAITPPEYKEFANWTRSDNGVISGNVFYMPGENLVLYAWYKDKNEKYTITYYDTAEDTTPVVDGPLPAGTSYTLLNPTDSVEGKTFTGWKDQDSVPYDPNANVTLSKNLVLTGQWSTNPVYTITAKATPAEGGTLTYSVSGDTVTLTVTVNPGYDFDITKDLVAINKTTTGEIDLVGSGELVRTFTMPKANVEATATFTAKEYNLTYTVESGNGTITGDAKAKVNATVVPTVTASDSTISRVYYTVEGSSTETELSASSTPAYSFPMPNGNTTVHVEFVNGKVKNKTTDTLYDTLGAAIAAAETSAPQEIILLDDTAEGYIPVDGKEVEIDLNGHTHTFTNTTRAFNIGWSSAPTVTFKNGTIDVSTATLDGGAFYVKSGSVTIDNVTINGPTNGANGGAVFLNNATFTMNSGAITGSTISGQGGAVYAAGASSVFNMNGGVISGNTAGNSGGAVVIAGGAKFNMANSATIDGNKAPVGAGVYVAAGAEFTMKDSAGITANKATGNGGGVFLAPYADPNHAVFSMSGNAYITGNDAALGSGVYVNSASFTVAGNARVETNTKDNVYLASSAATIAASGVDSAASKTIGVTLATKTGTVTNGTAHAKYGAFFSDDTTYVVREGTDEVEIAGQNKIIVNKTGEGDVTCTVKGETVTYAVSGDVVTVSATPATGYTLGSLTSSESSWNGGTKTFTMGATEVTVTAAFDPITYTLKFDKNTTDTTDPADAPADYTCTYDVHATLDQTMTRTGYTLSGWDTDKNATTAAYAVGADVFNWATTATDVKLYAIWVADTFNVKFVNGSDELASLTVAYNGSVKDTEVPDVSGLSKTGYKLDPSWYIGEDAVASVTAYKVTSDTTFQTKWTPITYHLDYHQNIAGGATYRVDVDYESAVKAIEVPAALEREGYSLKYWTETAADDGTKYYAGTDYVDTLATTDGATVDLYAQWLEGDTYKVTFDTKGGTPATIETQSVVPGGKATKPASDPTKDYYDFMGWYEDDVNWTAEWNFDDPVTGNLALHAYWVGKDVNVTFTDTHGSASTLKTWKYGEKPDMPADPTYGDAIHHFDGWYTDDGTAGSKVTETDLWNDYLPGNYELFAHWAVGSYTITTFTNGGGELKATPTTADEGDSVQLTITLPTGKRLKEIQFTETDGITPITIAYVLAHDVDYSPNTTSIPMPGKNVYATAIFEDIGFKLTNDTGMKHGTVEYAKTAYNAGETVTLIVKPDDGYELYSGSLYVSHGSTIIYPNTENNTFSMDPADSVVYATFVPKSNTITYADFTGAHGSVSGAANALTDSTVSLTVTKDDGYSANVKVTKADNASIVVAEGNITSFMMPAYNVNVDATFTAGAYDITLIAGANGSLAGSPTSAQTDDEVILIVKPDEGYEVETVTYTPEGGSATEITAVSGVYKIAKMPAAKVTVNATFKASNYKVFTSAIGGGEVSVEKEDGWHITDTVNLTFDAKGNVLTDLVAVYKNSSDVDVYLINHDANAKSFTMPAANVTVTATYSGSVARIGDVYYTTFDAAFNKLENGDTLTLLTDVTITGDVYNVIKNFTLDLDGHTLDASAMTKRAFNIYGNTVTLTGDGTLKAASNAEFGGAVYVASGSFIMESGTISGGHVSGNGGAVLVASGASFTMTGGEIANCESPNGAVYVVKGATFTVSGAPVIDNNPNGNVYLEADAVITVGTGGLTDGASIGVTQAGAPSNITDSTGGAYYSKFSSDNPLYSVRNVSGKATLCAQHDITVTTPSNGTVTPKVEGAVATYAVTGDTVTVTIKSDEGYSYTGMTVTGTTSGTSYTNTITPTTIDALGGDYTFPMPNDNVTITATFVANYYYVTEDDTVANGTVDADKDKANIGDTITVTATPATGYILDRTYYTVDTDTADPKTEHEFTNSFTMPAADVHVFAVFVLDTFNIYDVGSDTNKGALTIKDEHGTEVNTAQMGDKIIVTAASKTGYKLQAIRVIYNTTEDVTVTTTYDTADLKDETFVSAEFIMPAANVDVDAVWTEIASVTDDGILEKAATEYDYGTNYFSGAVLVKDDTATYFIQDYVLSADATALSADIGKYLTALEAKGAELLVYKGVEYKFVSGSWKNAADKALLDEIIAALPADPDGTEIDLALNGVPVTLKFTVQSNLIGGTPLYQGKKVAIVEEYTIDPDAVAKKFDSTSQYYNNYDIDTSSCIDFTVYLNNKPLTDVTLDQLVKLFIPYSGATPESQLLAGLVHSGHLNILSADSTTNIKDGVETESNLFSTYVLLKPKTATITYVATEGVTFTLTDGTSAPYGNDYHFKVTVDPGYKLLKVMKNGYKIDEDTTSVDPEYTYTFKPENGSYELTALVAIPVTYFRNWSTDTDYKVTDDAIIGKTYTILPASTFDPEDTPYVFTGWNTAADGSGSPYTAGSTPTSVPMVPLYAQWEAKYTVKYVAGLSTGGGLPKTEINIKKGENKTLYTPSTDIGYAYAASEPNRTYTFKGWVTDVANSYALEGDTVAYDVYNAGSDYTVNGDVTFYPHFTYTEDKLYNLIFDDALDPWLAQYVTIKEPGATQYYLVPSGQYTAYKIGADARIDAADMPDFMRLNYTFDGWYLKLQNGAAAEPKFDEAKKLTQNNIDTYASKTPAANGAYDVYLYAKWTASPDTARIQAYNPKDADAYIYYSDRLTAKAGDTSYDIYRRFVLVGADGTKDNPSKLPEGLFLNELTGEIYGVPTAAPDTYTFYVRLMNDDGKFIDAFDANGNNKKTITINKLTLGMDYNGTAAGKIFGETDDPKDFSTGKLAYVLLNDVDVTAATAMNASTTVYATRDDTQTLTLTFSYAQPVVAYNPANPLTAADPDATHVVLAGATHSFTVGTTRTPGENAGTYKVYLESSEVKPDAAIEKYYNPAVPAPNFEKQENTTGYDFVIRQKDINTIDSYVVTNDVKTLTYTTKQITPYVIAEDTLSVNPTTGAVIANYAYTLTQDVDYTLSYGKNINVYENGMDVNYVVINGKGNYKGTTIHLPFDILRKNIADDDVIATAQDMKYAGGAIVEPSGAEIRLCYNGVYLVDNDTYSLGIDYHVTSASGDPRGKNTDVDGNGKDTADGNWVTVKAWDPERGNYTGSKKVLYKILPVELHAVWNPTTLPLVRDYSCGPDAKPYVVSLDDNGTDFPINGDKVKGITYSYYQIDPDTAYVTALDAAPVNIGDYKVVATLGNKNYTIKSGQESANYKIEPKSLLTDIAVTVTPTSAYYTGSDVTPDIKLTFGAYTLAPDVDYSIDWSGYRVNADTYTATITGKGNFKDSITADFTILPRPIKIEAKDGTKEYGQAEPDPLAAYVITSDVADPAIVTTDSVGVKLIRESGEDAKDYAINAYQLVGDADVVKNYQVVDFTPGTFTITPKSLAGAKIALDKPSAYYTGEDVAPTVTVTMDLFGNADYTVSADAYTVTWTKQSTGAEDYVIDADTYTVKVTAKAGGNFTDYEIGTDTFTVNPASVKIKADNKSKAYGAPDPTLTATVTGKPDKGAKLEYTLERDPGNNASTNYTIRVKLGTNPNYAITTETGVLSIGASGGGSTPGTGGISSSGGDAYTLKLGETVNGTIAFTDHKGKTELSVTQNTLISLTVTPAANFLIDKVTYTTTSKTTPTELTANADGTYTIKMPNETTTVTATFKPENDNDPSVGKKIIAGFTKGYASCTGASCPLNRFVDLRRDAWYHDGIHYCLDNGIMQGFGNEYFKPDATTTRAQVVTVLWNIAGHPIATSDLTFGDVQYGQWYYNAITWAAANGLVNGYGRDAEGVNHFGPNDPITREQLAKILYGYAVFYGFNVDDTSDLAGYQGVDEISGWALPYVKWAVGSGLCCGQDGNSHVIAPKDYSTRAELATMIFNFCTKVAVK